LLHDSIYLFPLTADAVLVYHILTNNGYDVKGFCDSSAALYDKNYCGCPVVPRVSGENETVIICGYKQHRLSGLFTKSITAENILTNEDVAPALEKIHWEEFEKLAPRQQYRFRRLHQEIRQLLPPDNCRLTINALDIFLTEHCSLKCKFCEVLVQHFTNPRHFPFEQLMKETDAVFNKVDFVRDIHILGGEPFIYPQLAGYMCYLKKYRKKIGSLYVITNGTVVPKESVLDAIYECDAFVMISDYRELSRKKDLLAEACKKRGLGVQITDYPWSYENQLVYEDAISRQQKFTDCYERKHINTIRDGKCYYCHFLASGETLRAIPFDERNSISLYNSTGGEIVAYLTSETAPPGCQYCSGHDLKTVIPKAEQTESTLPYKSFEETYGN
jgi:organic radical activating enzyme